MKDALRATGRREPGQVRKEAALSGEPRAFGSAYPEPSPADSRPGWHVEPDRATPSIILLCRGKPVPDYFALARKYRPATFDDMVGQEPIAAALKNAVLNRRVSHAYIFAGPRGVGKTSLARILAKALNCPNVKDATPCNECDICRAISAGQDVDVLEIDAASHRTVEEIRPVVEGAAYRPTRSPYKVFIIDEAHMLSRHAFNSLLKTIEEPPPYVLFILATTEPEKLPDTIRSRCQEFDFPPLGLEALLKRLSYICRQEGFKVEAGVLRRIARYARGSMRDAISLLDQLVAFAGNSPKAEDLETLIGAPPFSLLARIVTALLDSDPAGLSRAYAEATSKINPERLADELLYLLRDLLVLRLGGGHQLLRFFSLNELQTLGEPDPRVLTVLFSNLLEVRNRMRVSAHGDLLLEVALMRAAQRGAVADIVKYFSQPRKGNPSPQTASTPSATKTPAPSSPAAPPQKPVSPLQNWTSFRTQILMRLQKAEHRAMIASATLLSFKDDLLVVGVHPSFMERDLALEGLKRELSTVVSRLLERAVRVRLEPDPSLRKRDSTMPQELKESVEVALRLFPGSVVEEVRDARNGGPDETGAGIADED